MSAPATTCQRGTNIEAHDWALGIGWRRSRQSDRIAIRHSVDGTERPGGARWLSVLVFLTLSSASIEGYLLQINSGLSKVPPTILLMGWIAHLLHYRRLPKMHVVSWLAGVLLGIVTLSSAINSDNPYVPLYYSRWAPYLILVVVLVDVLASVVELRVAVAAIVAGAVISAGGALYSFLILHADRATGPLQDPNDLAYVLVAAIPLALLGLPPQAGTLLRLSRACSVMVLAAGAAATLSRGAAVAALAAFTWALVRRLVSLRAVTVTLLIVAVASSVVWALAAPAIKSAYAQKDYIAQSNVKSRELRWEAAARELAEHPVFGVGPGGTRRYYVASSDNAELADQTPVTHNMYLEVGAELGLPGLMIFVALIVAALASSELALRRRERELALAVQASLLMICVASTFLSEEYYMALWGTIAIAAAMQMRPGNRALHVRTLRERRNAFQS